MTNQADLRRFETFKILWANTTDPGHVNSDGQHIGFYAIHNWYPLNARAASCKEIFDYIFTQRPELLQRADAFDLRPIDYAAVWPAKRDVRHCYKNAKEWFPSRPMLRKLLLDAGSPPPQDLKGTVPCAFMKGM